MFDFTAILTICIQGLGTTVNILSSLCKHFQLWANLYRRSTFELNLLFSTEQEILKNLQATLSLSPPSPLPFSYGKKVLNLITLVVRGFR